MNENKHNEVLRKKWLQELRNLGELTDYTQSTSEDEQYIDITTRDFGLLEQITTKYVDLIRSSSETPSWVQKVVDCLDCDGGSPLQMQEEMIICLQ